MANQFALNLMNLSNASESLPRQDADKTEVQRVSDIEPSLIHIEENLVTLNSLNLNPTPPGTRNLDNMLTLAIKRLDTHPSDDLENSVQILNSVINR